MPTGSVDPTTANYIFETFRRLNKELGLTIVIVTHDMTVAGKVQRVVSIRDGKISSERIMKEDYLDRLQEASLLDGRSHEEYAVLDRANRVQLPPELVSQTGIEGNRVKMTVENGRIIISPSEK